LEIILPEVPCGEDLDLTPDVATRPDEEFRLDTDDEDQPTTIERQSSPSREGAISNDVVPRVTYAEIPIYSKGDFAEVCVASIQRPLMIVENQLSQLRWNNSAVEVHPPATEVEVRLPFMQIIL
jgi:hypothetical protein